MARRATFSRPKPKKPKAGGVSRPKTTGGPFRPDGWDNPWQHIDPGGTNPYNPKNAGTPLAAADSPGAPQGLPIDPIYDSTKAGIGYERTMMGQEYGYDAMGAFDPSNPYSKATLLERSFYQGQNATTNSMASQGQLYSGAHQTNLDEGTFKYKRDEDSLKRAAARGYQSLSQAEQEAEYKRRLAEAQAAGDRVGRASGG